MYYYIGSFRVYVRHKSTDIFYKFSTVSSTKHDGKHRKKSIYYLIFFYFCTTKYIHIQMLNDLSLCTDRYWENVRNYRFLLVHIQVCGKVCSYSNAVYIIVFSWTAILLR